MPVGWIAKRSTVQEEIAEELARIEALRTQGTVELPEREEFVPTEGIPQEISPLSQTRLWQPQAFSPTPIAPPIAPPVAPTVKKITEPEEVSVPFWQRALQVFTAPFEWIDETVIKPGLALMSTTSGFVPEVERQAGEDFWEWKKRSWEGWKVPSLNINVPWSDDPWRIDIKGVLELAPWLLIPGAGQVGGGLRAARGVAGVLGKLGKVGRVVGTAVEYSPWGLVEKTAGVAIKGGIRAVGKISERVSTAVGEKLFGKYVPPPIPPEVQKLTNYFKEVVMPARKTFGKLVPEQVRSKQEAAVQAIFARQRQGRLTAREAIEQAAKVRAGVGIKGQFAITPEALATRQAKAITEVEARVVSGELSEATGKALITKINKNPAFTYTAFTDAEIGKLLNMIVEGTESGLVKVDSGTAFLELLTQGKLPFPHNIRDWGRVFGDDFAKSVGRLAKTPGVSGSGLVDKLNLPRAVLASTDLSATGRQGLILTLMRPHKAPLWFGRQIKSLFSEKLALQIDDKLRARPLFKEFIRAGGYIAPMRGAIPTKAEELFMSDLARRIPFVRRSERAFITYLNEARMATFEAAHTAMTAQGATQAQFKILADFINMASGRGTLPKSLEKYSPILNTVLFSPRLQAATMQLPRQIGRMLLSGNPYMRKEAAKALITFVGGGTAVLGLLKATGNKVETDPRAGDFGKVIIGETRLDIWRGYLQYTRFVAQMLTGERKSAYGNMNKAQRSELAGRFLQSKSSPAFGLLVDLLRGETYLGKPIFNDTTGFSRVAMERVLPLVIQDIIDATEMSGMNGLWVAAPVVLGIGALTYVNDFVRIKERIAREMGFKSWDDIDPKTQREIGNRNTELQAATIEFDRQVMGTAWGDWRLAGKAVEGIFRGNIEQAVAQYKATGDGVQFRERVGDAFIARRGGYAAREAEARFEDIVKRLNIEDTVESMVALGPEQQAIKIYNDALYGADMYDEFGDYRFDEAEIRKQQLRQELGIELFDYVEEYRGLKYEDLPREYQELVRARQILRPYWQVMDRAIKLFGEPRTPYQKRRIDQMVQKVRQQMRATNPLIAKYYEMFYQRT